VARIAALLTAFFPSLIAWSAINLKDVLTVLMTTVAIYGLVRYARRHEWWALVLCLAAFLAIENLRQFVFFILAWLMPIAFLFADRSERDPHARRQIIATGLGVALTWPLFNYLWNPPGMRDYLAVLPIVFFAPAFVLFANRSDRRQKLFLLLPLLLGVVLLNFATNNEKLGTNFLTPKALTEAEWKRWLEENKAETGIGEFEGIKPPKEMATIVERSIAALPRGVFYVFFGPLPWEAPSLSARAVIPEMLLWYGLLAAAVIGLAASIRSRWRDLVLPLGFTVSWVVALALTEGNTGNIFRHRSQFSPFVLMVSAAGLLWLWNRWQARSLPPSSTNPAPEG
jgi:4-amino-4-deoxy-L-arabinose transferase-like glycosyltransferase